MDKPYFAINVSARDKDYHNVAYSSMETKTLDSAMNLTIKAINMFKELDLSGTQGIEIRIEKYDVEEVASNEKS